MVEPPSVELSRGFSHPRELVGRTLILRPRHDVGFPLVVGIFSALIAVALGFVVAVTTHSLGINVLVAIELALAIGIGWFALLMLRDALDHLRFNRRDLAVHFTLDHIELRSREGVEPLALADVRTHPALRGLAIDPRVVALLRARSACRGLSPDSDLRLVLETLALYYPEAPELDHPPPTRPCYAIIVGPGEVNFFHDPDELPDARSTGLPLYRVDTDWSPDERVYLPRLRPDAVTRISAASA